MCHFFSFVTDPDNEAGRRFYFDREKRKANPELDHDSHSSICKFFGLNEDKCNKYEYNFPEKELNVDTLNSPVDDTLQVKEWVDKLSLEKIIELKVMKKKGWKIGDTLVWKRLSDIRQINNKRHILLGWNTHMDELTKSGQEFVIDAGMAMAIELGTRISFCPDGRWEVSSDMVRLKKVTV